jgi:hypothetical protein
MPVFPSLAYKARLEANIIAMDDDEPITNIFCFGAFAVVSYTMTSQACSRSCPFNDSVCFFALYHYESNSILITPIVGLDNMSMFNAYKTQFDDIDELKAKGFKPKLNIMDNQAT